MYVVYCKCPNPACKGAASTPKHCYNANASSSYYPNGESINIWYDMGRMRGYLASNDVASEAACWPRTRPSPSALTRNSDFAATNKCALGVYASEIYGPDPPPEYSTVVLGSTFMETYCTVHEFGNWRIGFSNLIYDGTPVCN
ncbi:hypothetical protein AAVH_36880 [Aphelenchoides avenae]|nr:hypothetical protein AAVH_36880 [Aphelenchus avenae]